MAKIVRQIPWGRTVVVLLLVFWLIFLILSLGILKHEPDQQANQRISQALRDLQSLHHQREEISKLLTEYSGNLAVKQEEKESLFQQLQEKVLSPETNKQVELADFVKGRKEKMRPSLKYEKLRRRIHNGIEEMWYFVSSQIKQIQKKSAGLSPKLVTQLNKILDEGIEHKRSLLNDIVQLPEYDGYGDWRLKEAADLSDLVQRRLSYLQNPSDCDKAKKLVCKLNKGCGYGCQLHHAVYCLLVAYGTERTMILQSKGWRYNRDGWEDVFLPVSDSCTTFKGVTHPWPGNINSQTITLGIVDSISPRPPFLPLTVPKDLAERIERLHGDPPVWWVGQFLKYLLRPTEKITDMLAETAGKSKYTRPIVGVHIRRTDKVGTEAAFHSVDEYMLHVEEYFKQISLRKPVDKKRIYLASDDFKLFDEVKAKYPEYEVLGDPQVAKTAAVATRYSDTSLNGIIMDIYFLAQSDYLVCTFSSQVCRVAYEIMQSLHADAADRFKSLDDIWYYGGQGIHKKIAVQSHKANSPDQMDLEVGDIVGVAGNHWDGYSKGRNLRTNKYALYPSYKVDDLVQTYEFPTYKKVPLKAEHNP